LGYKFRFFIFYQIFKMYKMKHLSFFLLFLFFFRGNANMASPLEAGTKSSTVLTSKDVDILSEKIRIVIDKNFKTARFYIEYVIRVDSAGQQIPLLFYADNYKGDFSVWVDGQKVPVQKIPKRYIHVADSPFSGFKPTVEQKQGKNPDKVTIYWNEGTGYVYDINDLKYFETDLTKGLHNIRVVYTAKVWEDRSGWIKSYSFRYSLSPAKFWKSFGKLHITVEQEGKAFPYTTNLGQPLENRIQSVNTWEFDRLPVEYLEITYQPEINRLAKLLIAISPEVLTLITGVLLTFLLLLFLYVYQKKYQPAKYRILWLVAGSLLVIFLTFLSYPFAHDMIRNIIGEDAGMTGFYSFLIFFYFLFVFPVYLVIVWILMWLIEKYMLKN